MPEDDRVLEPQLRPKVEQVGKGEEEGVGEVPVRRPDAVVGPLQEGPLPP